MSRIKLQINDGGKTNIKSPAGFGGVRRTSNVQKLNATVFFDTGRRTFLTPLHKLSDAWVLYLYTNY